MDARSHRLTVLSAGLLLYDILSDNEGLKAAGCSKVFERLQRPLPVASSFFPTLSDASNTATERPFKGRTNKERRLPRL